MRIQFHLSIFVAFAALSACTFKPEDNSSTRAPIADYCPYVAVPRSFSGGITVSGTATYQYRNDGNGAIVDGGNTYKPNITGSALTYTMTVGAKSASYTCSSGPTCTLLNVVNGLSTAMNTALCNGVANVTNPSSCSPKPTFYTHGVTAIDVYPTNGIDGSSTPSITVTNMTAQGPRPIRYAEVQITSADGTLVQCTETDGSGNFSAQIPGDGASYNVNVMARSSNSHNTAYIMNNPNDNVPYKITAAVQSLTSTSVNLKALASGTMEGGAFNILDQILNAQEYLRTTTANCGTNGSGTYLQGCTPVQTIPVVYTYWTPGLTPNVYYGDDSPISFYLLGQRELYIGGGADGDTTNSDMDQFDNSVIVHEYGHFIEDQFGKPDSPGGSHSGQYVIDPRLAWGEGWANFFQAAVSGVPVYRDTYGSLTCGKASCATGTAFMVALESGTPFGTNDTPSTTGEGNFREFSVSRVLWAIIQPSISQFSEIWTALNGSAGMRVVSDNFKTVTRLHAIHENFAAQTNKKDWSTPLSNEKQLATFTDYATPLDTSASCTTSSIAMAVRRDGYDDGSYERSNQFTNNDFYLYSHTGGSLPVSLTWSSDKGVDLDLYIYRAGYIFGGASSVLAYDIRDANGSSSGSAIKTTGSASVAPNLPAGLYMINVMAATGSMSFGATGAAAVTYSLNVANHAACPAP